MVSFGRLWVVAIVAVVMFGGCCGSALAQFGAGEFAARLAASGRLHHDGAFHGPEVVYMSSGVATQEAAVSSWMLSRAGHRELLVSGAITEIACVGNACVGRGAPTVSRSVTRTRQSTRSPLVRRLFR